MYKILLLFFSIIPYYGFTKTLNIELPQEGIVKNHTFNIKASADIPFEKNAISSHNIDISPASENAFPLVTYGKLIKEIIPKKNGKNLSFYIRFSRLITYKAVEDGTFYTSLAVLVENSKKSFFPKSTILVSNTYKNITLKHESYHKSKFYAEISKQNPYIGEYVKASLKVLLPPNPALYLREFLDPPTSKDAYIESIYVYSDAKPKRKITSQGIEVTVEEFLIYPLKAGKITIHPRKLAIKLNGQEQEMTHGKILLDVQDPGFALSGDFAASTHVNISNPKIGDKIKYTLIISGSGDLMHYDFPDKQFVIDPKHLSILDNGSSFEFTSEDKSQSKKEIFFILQVLNDNGKIPEVKLDYFNTNTKQSNTLIFSPPKLEINNHKTSENQSTSNITDTLDLKKYKFLLIPLVVALSILLLIIVFIFYLKNKKTTSKNKESVSSHTSQKTIETYIKTIEQEFNKKNYYLMYKYGMQFLSDLTQLEISEISQKSIESKIDAGLCPESVKIPILQIIKNQRKIDFSQGKSLPVFDEISKDLNNFKKISKEWSLLNHR